MLKLLRYLLASDKRNASSAPAQAQPAEPPADLIVVGAESFPLSRHLDTQDDLPVLDWSAVSKWVEGIETPEHQAEGWSQAELGWLAHLQAALGANYRLERLGQALLLSSLEPNVAQASLTFMNKTLKRIGKVLDGLAQESGWGHDILIVFDDDDTYYRYISRYYPEGGEFAGSSGMHINHGCGHFVTMKSDLRVVEPIIAHEMTHSCLSHLPIPAWLNEGLAVNTEQRLSPPPPPILTPHQMHAKHLKFWGPTEIQEFWSGKSFLRAGDGNMLSYDLARILVAQFSGEWKTFESFVLAASYEDSGQASAAEHLAVDLGAAVCAILERAQSPEWAPLPSAWPEMPERGACPLGDLEKVRSCRC